MTTHRITHHMIFHTKCDISHTHHITSSSHHITSLHHIISHCIEWHGTSHDITFYITYHIAAHHTPHNISLHTSPYWPGSHLLYKYNTTVQSTSWPRLTLLQYSASLPFVAFFYKCISILHCKSLPWVTLLLCLHYYTAFYVTALGHTSSASASRHCPSSNSFLQIHHHTAFYVTATGHTSTRASPYCTLRHCFGSLYFYKQIIILDSI